MILAIIGYLAAGTFFTGWMWKDIKDDPFVLIAVALLILVWPACLLICLGNAARTELY